jgi:predicted O-methyltransferase YrrM
MSKSHIIQRFNRMQVSPVFVPESGVSPHDLTKNWEAGLFETSGGGSTEIEYLTLLAALVGIYKPTTILETGSLNGDGTIALLMEARSGAVIHSICGDPIESQRLEQLKTFSSEKGVTFDFLQANTNDLMDTGQLSELVVGDCTFAFLDSSIPDREREFEYLTNPKQKALDLTRRCCICIHDMSLHRDPSDSDSKYQPNAIKGIKEIAQKRNWQLLHLNQSRGMMVLVYDPHISDKEPTASKKN